MELTSQFIETFTKLANKSALLSFDAEPTVYDKIFKLVNVDDEFGGLDHGQGTEILGATEPTEMTSTMMDHKFSDTGEGWSYYWKLRYFQDGFQFDQNTLKNWGANDQYASSRIDERSKNLGEAFQRFRDRFAANLFNRGAITAGDKTVMDGTYQSLQTDPQPGKIYTGFPFLYTAHPLKRAAGTTFQNHYASLSFSGSNLETALTRYRVTNAKGELNEEIMNEPNVLVYNPTIDMDVERILKSTLEPGTANNAVNPLQGRVQPIPWHKLSTTTAWALGKRQRGIWFLHRGAPKTQTVVDKFKGLGVISFSMTDEIGVCVTQWRDWMGANFPTT